MAELASALDPAGPAAALQAVFLVHAAIGIGLLVRWLHEVERGTTTREVAAAPPVTPAAR